MSDRTSIEWTDTTWNPVRGCSRASSGCEHCYAERMASRFCGPGEPYEGLARRAPARWTGEVTLVPRVLAEPLKWRKARRVFVNSMSDLFHAALTDEQIAAVFGVIAATPQHTYQILTKRPERMRAWCASAAHDGGQDWPLVNLWLGVSVEDQQRADERIPALLATPAARRFVSCEPLLGPVRFNDVPVLRRVNAGPQLDWVIVGGESGPGARPMDEDWVRAIRDQCKAAGVPFFYKQRLLDGGRKIALPLLDGRQHTECPC